MKKAAQVGVSALVVGGVRHKDLTTFTGQEIGVAITGQEELGSHSSSPKDSAG